MLILILLFLLLFLTTSFLLLKAVFSGKENTSKLEIATIASFTLILIGIVVYLGRGTVFNYPESDLEKHINQSLGEFMNIHNYVPKK